MTDNKDDKNKEQNKNIDIGQESKASLGVAFAIWLGIIVVSLLATVIFSTLDEPDKTAQQDTVNSTYDAVPAES